MINGLPVTAIIPVRGGSKGLPGKNLRRLGKDSLLERTIKQGKLCPYIDKVVVSTDDKEMFNIATALGVASPGIRPSFLADDAASTIDVILYTLDEMGINNGYILLLQTTSPLRTVDDISNVCEALENSKNDAKAIVTVSAITSSHPDKLQKIEDGYLSSYLGRNSHVSRQSLPEVYQLNGACYLTQIDIVKQEKTLIPENTLPHIMSVESSINLDTMLDWYLLEKLIEEDVVSIEEYED